MELREGGDDDTLKVLLGVTGSVAAIKTLEIARLLKSNASAPPGAWWKRVEVKVVATQKSQHFFDPGELAKEVSAVHFDEDEWQWKQRGDPVLHIEITKWADVFVVVPTDALTLSKLARGHCDNLLTCALMAWPVKDSGPAGERAKPLVVCPSMNTKMWAHPATRENLRLARSFGARVVGPISKRLMCGDVGAGAMQEPAGIAADVLRIASEEGGKRKLSSTESATYLSVAVAVAAAAAGLAATWVLFKK